MSHPELGTEQRYFDLAAEHRERRRNKALDPNAGNAGIHPAAAAAIREANLARASDMGAPDSAVAFWRFTEDNGDTYYVGYFPILDEDLEPLVISWKADKASLFKRSTREERLGVRSKRVYTTEKNTILDIVDEDLTDDGASFIVNRDAILRSLSQSRHGLMRDIVTTIDQAQDEVMRSPSDGVLIVQGGPGTGKTVIGLQRLSVIAYREQYERDQLLFVGPNTGFLRYVSSVLPTLGDEGVRQLTVSSLSPYNPRRLHPEPNDVARLKGDSRMVDVLKRALDDRRSKPDAPVSLMIDNLSVTLSPDSLEAEYNRALEAQRPHNIGREFLREGLLRLIRNRLSTQNVSDTRIRSAPEFNNLIDRMWPTLSPQEFIRDLLGSERRLRAHSQGIFEGEELLRIARPPQARLSDEPWSVADMALIDEAEVLLNGSSDVPTYDHIVVDEAQDLSPMQLRAIARRRRGGMTILGDLAQATGPWPHRSWDQIGVILEPEGSFDYVELEVGYRVPREVMEVANRVAESLDLPVTLPKPIRDSGHPPSFIPAESDRSALRAAITEVRNHLAAGRSVGLIADHSILEEIATALRYEDLEFARSEDSTQRSVTLSGATASKGLEFDAVVVVEPGDIADGPSGLAGLFVAMTRTTGPLSIVFSKPLPDELAEFAPPDHPGQDEDTPTPATDSAPEVQTTGGSKPSTTPDEDPVPSVAPPSEPPRISPADVALDALVDWVASEVQSTLNPDAIARFLQRLEIRLQGTEDDESPL